MNTEGYKSKEYGQPTKRFVQTMQLKDDSELMKEYRKAHDKDHFWREYWRWRYTSLATVW